MKLNDFANEWMSKAQALISLILITNGFLVLNKTRVIPHYIKEKRILLRHRENWIMKMPVFFSFIDSETCVCKNLLRSGFFVLKENTSLRSNPLFRVLTFYQILYNKVNLSLRRLVASLFKDLERLVRKGCFKKSVVSLLLSVAWQIVSYLF